jgi:hypothetical protein
MPLRISCCVESSFVVGTGATGDSAHTASAVEEVLPDNCWYIRSEATCQLGKHYLPR